MQNQYVPGQCNIGIAEKRLRLRLSVLSFAITLTLLALLYILNTDKLFRLILFPSIFATLINYFQSRHSFCIKFGIFKEYNFGNDIGVTAAIVDKESIRKDRNKSIEIIIKSFLLSLLIIGCLVVL